jgi:hypothetical protein
MDTSTKTDTTPAGAETSETSANGVPHEVVEVIGAVRAFTDTVERVGAEEFGEAARLLRKPELAWLLDRLDDVRGSVTGLLDALAEQAEQYGADVREFHQTLGELETAGEGIYEAMQAIDPEAKRMNIIGL